MSMKARAGIIAAAMAATALLGTTPAANADSAATADRHCVVEVVGEEDGVLVTGPEHCYSSYAEARSASQEREYAETESRTPESNTTAASSSNTIGVHFTGQNYTGSSISIVGTVCSGGVWYPTGSWDNNIESSWHYCGGSPTTFYDSSTCSGSPFRAIFGSVSTLYTMDNKASCVRYG